MKKYNQPICPTADWTIDNLQQYADAFDAINEEKYNLDVYNNQIEVITAKRMIDAYSSHAMPVYPPHWSYGMAANEIEKAYRKGQMGLAYEVVINSDPCIAYLMEENSSMMQALVISHASYGHNSFFKGNYMFKETQASNIVDYLTMARKYILACEEKYGPQEVEVLLDACHVLERHAVNQRRKSTPLTKDQQRQERLDKIKFLQQSITDLDSVTPLSKEEQMKRMKNAISPDIDTRDYATRNILKFIGQHSVHLQQWQRNIIDMICYISDYFKPQIQTQLMNEGWATFWHYQMMHDLEAQGGLSNGQMVEFYSSHTAVTAQPGYTSPYYSGINVYALGFHMMQKIKQVCIAPTLADSTRFSFAGCGEEWVNIMKEIMMNYRDESFIQEFLTEDTCKEFNLFSVRRDSDLNYIEVTGTARTEELKYIKRAFADSRDIINNVPDLAIESYDPTGDRTLVLTHRTRDFRRIYTPEMDACLDYIQHLWGDAVLFEEYDVPYDPRDGNEQIPVQAKLVDPDKPTSVNP
jgi:spore cortex formation protein SpoVR/YcgB (stage V sporulation)